ncbi:MAG: nucleotide sugar dehydrogenase, partial [Propionibacterium sp.]|nr:nucleotide sugar dehydrogenase [Propionibacterium sp.]
DAAILQADHPEYLDLTAADLPGVSVIIDGRGVLKRENFAGIAFFRIGDGE